MSINTIEILGYEWCIWAGTICDETDYEFIQTLHGDWMVYCQREKWRDEKGNGGFRTVPVSRADITTIDR